MSHDTECRVTGDNELIVTQGDAQVTVHCHDEVTEIFTITVDGTQAEIAVINGAIAYVAKAGPILPSIEPNILVAVSRRSDLIVAACQLFIDIIVADPRRPA